MTSTGCKFIEEKIENGIQIIKLCRLKKKNAINTEMYQTIITLLSKAAENDNIVITVITGEGDFYSSGNDFGFDNILPDPSDRFKLFRAFTDAIIDYPKVLIAVVNGPAIGVACTTLALFDVVYASEKAYFLTPFSKIGLNAEGCSTYTFPKIFGKTKAMEMILLCHKLTAKEALHYGFISEILTENQLRKDIWDKIRTFSKLQKQSLKASKHLVQRQENAILHEVNKRETESLIELVNTEETINALLNFRSKL